MTIGLVFLILVVVLLFWFILATFKKPAYVVSLWKNGKLVTKYVFESREVAEHVYRLFSEADITVTCWDYVGLEVFN